MITLPDDAYLHEARLALQGWADKYRSRIDKDLHDGWPDLKDRIQDAVGRLSWKELATGPGSDFQKERLNPAVEAWVSHYVEPIIEDAAREFQTLACDIEQSLSASPAGNQKALSGLSSIDVLEALTLPMGATVAGVAVVAAIGKVTTLIIFTSIIVKWPLLIAGLIVGGVLIAVGALRLATLKDRLRGRIERHLLPQIKDAIVGNGVVQGGRHEPSLRQKLTAGVDGALDKALQKLNQSAK